MRRLRLLLSVSLLFGGMAWGQGACVPPTFGTGSPDARFDQLFTQSGPGWTGGDSTYSVRLPDGRTVWIFSDSFIGTVDPKTRMRSNAMFQAHNALVVQDASNRMTTLYNGSQPSFFQLNDGSADWFWLGDGMVETVAGTPKLRLFLTRFRSNGSGIFGFEFVGTYLATLSLPELKLESTQDLKLGSKIVWSAALLSNGGYSYVYGDETHYAHVARVAAGSLGDVSAWQFWNGSEWVADANSSVRMLDASISDEFSVTKVGGAYVLTTMDTSPPFYAWKDIVVYTSCEPTGPWTGRTVVYQTPETGKDSVWPYNPHAHSEWTSNGGLLVSYDINTGDTKALVYADRYRPKFIRVPLSCPAKSPCLGPAPPRRARP